MAHRRPSLPRGAVRHKEARLPDPVGSAPGPRRPARLLPAGFGTSDLGSRVHRRGARATFDVRTGDVGYVPFAMGHHAENTGDTTPRSLETSRLHGVRVAVAA